MPAPAPRRLWQALVGHRREDEGVAVVFDADSPRPSRWTGKKLAEVTEALGDRIAAVAGAGKLVGFLSPSQETQALHYLAVLAAGATPAILTPPTARQEPTHARSTLRSVVAAVQPPAIISDLADDVLSLVEGVTVLRAWSAAPERAYPEPLSVAVPDQAAFVQFSSGTTGLKKGVAVTYEAVMSQISTYAEVLRLTAPTTWDGGRIADGDAIVSWLPLYHDMGFLTALHLPLATGLPVAMIDPVGWSSRLASYLRTASAIGATLGWHPNFAFNLMATRVRDDDIAGVDLSRPRMLANCSEPATWLAQQRFADRYRPYGLRPDVISGCYAMAETTFAVTHGPGSLFEGLDGAPPAGSGHDRRPMVSVGRVLPGVTMSVRETDGTQLGERTVGEIWVQAPFLAAGYLSNPEAAGAAFVDGWYRTGDLGYRDGPDWYVSGRCKDLLIVAGHNVFPGDVEAIVGELEGFKAGRVAAFSELDDTTQSERVVILAEPDGTARPDLVGARQRLVAELGLSRIAIELVPPGWLIKSSSGKMARSACARKWAAERCEEAQEVVSGSAGTLPAQREGALS